MVTTGDLGQQVPSVVRLLANPSSTLTLADRNNWADRLVLTFAAVPASNAAKFAVAAEVASVCKALEALSGGDFAVALESTSGLRRDSTAEAFSQWGDILSKFDAELRLLREQLAG